MVNALEASRPALIESTGMQVSNESQHSHHIVAAALTIDPSIGRHVVDNSIDRQVNWSIRRAIEHG